MNNCSQIGLSFESEQKLSQFKDYAVFHTHLLRVDKVLMHAITEPAGFAHVLVYGPSGVGKTTMLHQIIKRLNEEYIAQSVPSLGYHNKNNWLHFPLLLLETRPPDGPTFNRVDYYRTALKCLGEPFYERRTLVNIDADQTWEKKGRSRGKTAQFDDSPELRNALEEAIKRRGVRAVLLDEPPPNKTTRKKRSSKKTAECPTNQIESTPEIAPTPKKRQSRKKTTSVSSEEIKTLSSAEVQGVEIAVEQTQPSTSEASVVKKKSAQRVGQRKPQRDKIGD